MSLHSIVIPVFNEEEGLHELQSRLESELFRSLREAGEDYELVLIDDGSHDRSFEIMSEFQKSDPRHLRVAKFSRNFGHQIAITAGLDLARGDTVTVIDADLQDPPKVILEMISEWKKGYDVVFGVRTKRLAEGFFKKITAKLFYRVLKSSTRLEIPMDVGDFRLLSRKAADALKLLREQHRFVRGMAKWIGFKQSAVSYVREGRFAGETKYPLKKMLRLAWDGFTGFSLLPLRLASWLGMSCLVMGILLVLCFATSIFFTETRFTWADWIIPLAFFLGGIQLLSLGILGEYVGRIFEQAKNRPLYILDQVLSND